MIEKGPAYPEMGGFLSDPELQAAVDRTAFSWGDLLRHNQEVYLELTRQRGLSDEEAWEVYATLNSRRRPNTDR